MPDLKVLGNAGSFFKNPTIPIQQFQELKEKYSKIVGYPTEKHEEIKVAAGWLIEQCGWKGKRVGNVGTYQQQSLILVNHGFATGQEVLAFATQIQESVYQKFGIMLTPETVIL